MECRKIAILGGGESGTGAAMLAKAHGCKVLLSDKGMLADVHRQELSANDIDFEEGGHQRIYHFEADCVIKSPGIPDTAPVVSHFAERGIPVISEIEYALRFTKAKIIGITGTNGKTTTTLLTYHLMQQCGFYVALAGNVGQSLARQLIHKDYDWVVLELSSFQLDGMQQSRIHIAVLTNITPDHLDRYGAMDAYIQSKFRIIQNQQADDYFIFGADNEAVSNALAHHYTPATMIGVSLLRPTAVHKQHEMLCFPHFGEEFKLDCQADVPLLGPHNQLNTMMAVAAVLCAGGQWADIKNGLLSFKNAPHRLEEVAVLNGIRFVNDSKATNIDSVKYALQSFKGKHLIWIVGGVDKGNDYTLLDNLVKDHVKAIVALGKDNTKIIEHFRWSIPNLVSTHSMAEAVHAAYQMAAPGDVVLLSPACASFDLFKNYEDRGQQFKDVVNQLIIDKRKVKTDSTNAVD